MTAALRVPSSLSPHQWRREASFRQIPVPQLPMRFLLALAGIVLGSALLACFLSASPSVEAGTARRMDIPAMVSRADLVIEGRVLSVQVSQAQNGVIESEYLIRVDRTLYGEDLALRVVRMPGGVLPDGRGMILAGMPQLLRGEDVILFLSRSNPGGLRMPIGLAQGKFGVSRDLRGNRFLVRDQNGLELVGNAGQKPVQAAPLAIRAYADALAEIQAAVVVRRAQDAQEQAGAGR